MKLTAISKFKTMSGSIRYRLINENGIQECDDTNLAYLIARGNIEVSNLGTVMSTSGQIKKTFGFTVGDNYPFSDDSTGMIYNAHSLTCLGYMTYNNNKLYVLSSSTANIIAVNSKIVKILQQYKLLTNLRYCVNGSIRLAEGTLEPVDYSIACMCANQDANYVNNYIKYIINQIKNKNRNIAV